LDQKWKNFLWVVLRGATFVVVSTFLIVGVIVGIFTSYWPLVNIYLKTFTTIQIDFRIFFAGATILAELYVLWLVRGFFLRFIPRKERKILVVKPARVHWILTTIILGFWALFLWMVLHIARAEILSGFSFFETASTVVFAIIVFIFITSVYPIVKLINLLPKRKKTTGVAKDTSIPRQKGFLSRRNVLILSAFVYFFIFILALCYLPANVASGPLPSKPQVVAHRGGSYLGPENTLEAITTALDFGVIGWEVDVRISLDGVPFLMHDDRLWRTTNIGQVFPTRAWDLATSFTWAELQQLNAGSWFVAADPYETIAKKIVREDRVTAYQSAKIPSLAQVVNFTRDHGLILNVDWRYPKDHPFQDQYFSICYNLIASANITAGAWIMDLTPSKFATFPSPVSKIVLMERGYIISPTVNAFRASGKEMINMPDNFFNIFYRSYESAGIPLNVFGVNTPWRFSQDWVLGVDYVTTDTPHLFVGMTEPESWMSAEEYYIRVIPTGLGGFAIATILYLYFRRSFSRKIPLVTAN
jgi:glycerophosphoryl diester phosphodiesterase